MLNIVCFLFSYVIKGTVLNDKRIKKKDFQILNAKF